MRQRPYMMRALVPSLLVLGTVVRGFFFTDVDRGLFLNSWHGGAGSSIGPDLKEATRDAVAGRVQMIAAQKHGAALLISWDDPYLDTSIECWPLTEADRARLAAGDDNYKTNPPSAAIGLSFTLRKGDTYHFELFSIGVPLDVAIKGQAGLTKRLAYLNEPTGMKILRGKRVASPGFVECAPDNYAVEVSVPKPAEKTNLTLPLRVNGLNRRWTAGLFQKHGYVKGDYGTGDNRYRPLAVDDAGFAYVPMYVDLADTTHMLAGHPVVADEKGKDLFIQVTRLYEKPDQWHVSVNNPTGKPITTTLRKTMDLPGLVLSDTKITVSPGEYLVLQ